MDDRGVLLFSADRNEVIIGSDGLRIMGEGGTSFSGSIQTTLVRAESGHDLRFVSTFYSNIYFHTYTISHQYNYDTICAMLFENFLSMPPPPRAY